MNIGLKIAVLIAINVMAALGFLVSGEKFKEVCCNRMGSLVLAKLRR